MYFEILTLYFFRIFGPWRMSMSDWAGQDTVFGRNKAFGF